jgi:hypothetical protein
LVVVMAATERCASLLRERAASAVGEDGHDGAEDGREREGRCEDQGPEGVMTLGHERFPFFWP